MVSIKFCITLTQKLFDFNIITDFCGSLGVVYYPSLYYFGYGNFAQKLPNCSFDSYRSQHIAKYQGELYIDALYDWVWLLHKISYFDKIWGRITSIFSRGIDRSSPNISALEAKVAKLQSDASEYGNRLMKYEALELFDNMPYEGDPFVLLNNEKPSKVRLLDY